MKKQFVILCISVIAIISVYSWSQEFIKPKTKKIYVSEQQDIELDGEIVVCGTKAWGILIELSKVIFSVLNAAVTRVNCYACGEKEGLGKVERTERYAKKSKIKEKIENCIEQLEKILQDINVLIATLNE